MHASFYRYDFTPLSIPRSSARVRAYYRQNTDSTRLHISSTRIAVVLLRYASQHYSISSERMSVSDTAAWNTINRQIDRMIVERPFIRKEGKHESLRLLRSLDRIRNMIPKDQLIWASVNQGQITPWNRYYEENRLYFQEWEVARNGVPVLFDLYHHVFCQCILQDKNDFKSVLIQLEGIEAQTIFRNLRQRFKVDTALHFNLYILFSASCFLRKDFHDRDRSPQHRRLLKAWISACDEILSKTGKQQDHE